VPSGRDELGDADEIVADEIEQKISGNANTATMLGLARDFRLSMTHLRFYKNT
jgi:hypothetical protein